MVEKGEVEKILIVNRDQAQVFLKKEAIAQYRRDTVDERFRRLPETGVQLLFTIGSVDSFREDLKAAEQQSGQVVPVAYKNETNDWTNVLINLLPWVVIIGAWFFIMRSMSVSYTHLDPLPCQTVGRAGREIRYPAGLRAGGGRTGRCRGRHGRRADLRCPRAVGVVAEIGVCFHAGRNVRHYKEKLVGMPETLVELDTPTDIGMKKIPLYTDSISFNATLPFNLSLIHISDHLL